MNYYIKPNGQLTKDSTKGYEEYLIPLSPNGTVLPKHKSLGLLKLDENGNNYTYYQLEMVSNMYVPNTAKIEKLYLKQLTAEYKGYYLDVVNAKLEELDYDSIPMVEVWLSDPMFGAEAQAIKDWYKSLITFNYQMVNDVKDGLPIPTKEEFINQLPKYEG